MQALVAEPGGMRKDLVEIIEGGVDAGPAFRLSGQFNCGRAIGVLRGAALDGAHCRHQFGEITVAERSGEQQCAHRLSLFPVIPMDATANETDHGNGTFEMLNAAVAGFGLAYVPEDVANRISRRAG
jgi:hypothetical protein